MAMLIEKDIKKILSQVSGDEPVHIPVDGMDITIRYMDDSSKLFLSTAVYSGGNYIPSSVRRCLSDKIFSSLTTLRTYLTVDESHFQITLNYVGVIPSLTSAELKELLEEFGLIAEKWRQYLDEHDKNDLIYVRIGR